MRYSACKRENFDGQCGLLHFASRLEREHNQLLNAFVVSDVRQKSFQYHIIVYNVDNYEKKKKKKNLIVGLDNGANFNILSVPVWMSTCTQ